jgi:hypothetical protein
MIAYHHLGLGEHFDPFGNTKRCQLCLPGNAIRVNVLLVEADAMMIYDVPDEYDTLTIPLCVEIPDKSPVTWMACWFMNVPDN